MYQVITEYPGGQAYGWNADNVEWHCSQLWLFHDGEDIPFLRVLSDRVVWVRHFPPEIVSGVTSGEAGLVTPDMLARMGVSA